MARPVKCRRVCAEPEYDGFFPNGIVSKETITLTVDEYEVIRLVDLEKKTHVKCAAQMGISKTTVTEIYESAREKIAECLVNGKPLMITGGNYYLCGGTSNCGKKRCCESEHISNTFSDLRKGTNMMRIAVTYSDGNIFQHFGHTEQFKVYDVEDNKVINSSIVDTNGQGHGALAGFLFEGKVDVLICGGIGGGAQNALAQAGIKLYGGVQGNADDAVAAYLEGKLDYNPNEMCSHHGHGEGHNCGSHSCGTNKSGCKGN
ncbi:MAG: DUF134 domain-containing protein [Eubacteriales bacterium]|nr:DUF134 domain-containing protein [Eubacteriales bacterium]